MISTLLVTQPDMDFNRGYHNTDAPYSLPNDNPEHARLEEQAERFRELMYHRIVHSPLDAPSMQKALDIGCGTGTVTHDIAAKFRAAQVYGLDLSPVPHVREKLPNIEYVQDNFIELSNASDPRFRKGSFDLIFSRLLIAGMEDWKGYVERCVALTKPGGWVEMHDIDTTWYGIPANITPAQRELLRPHTVSYPVPAYPTDSWMNPKPWVTTFQKVCQAAGLDATCGSQLPRFFHEAGLQDVRVTRYMYPWTNWEGYTDVEQRFVKHHHEDGMGVMIATLTRKVGSRQNVVSQEEVEQAALGYLNSIKERDQSPNFCWFYVVYGRKAVNEMKLGQYI